MCVLLYILHTYTYLICMFIQMYICIFIYINMYRILIFLDDFSCYRYIGDDPTRVLAKVWIYYTRILFLLMPFRLINPICVRTTFHSLFVLIYLHEHNVIILFIFYTKYSVPMPLLWPYCLVHAHKNRFFTPKQLQSI